MFLRAGTLVALAAAVGMVWMVGCGGDEEDAAVGLGQDAGLSHDGGSDGVVGDTNPTEGGGDPTSSIVQGPITWTFSSPVRYGTYANGDPWVLGPVTIASVSPAVDASIISPGAGICNGLTAGRQACEAACGTQAPATHTSHCTDDDICTCARVRNGFEVNPIPGGQGFDNRASDFDYRRLPSLPYTASGDQSIVQVVSVPDGEDDPIPCISSAAVLTVVSQVPPGQGADVFRPAYVGSDKRTIAVASMRMDLLPSLAPVAETPSLDTIRARFAPVQLDHLSAAAGRRIHPSEHMPNYGVDIGRDVGDGVLRLMLNDSVDAKRQVAIVVVQMGIDWTAAGANGRVWLGADGHETGRKLAIAFAGVMLEDTQIAAVAQNTALFEEDQGVYFSEIAGIPLYGYQFGGWTEETYWRLLVEEGGYKGQADPYHIIDGGWLDGGNYQGIVSPTWKGEALALRLMPPLQTIWSNPHFLNYADRWVNIGYWTQPDSCAPEDVWANYGVTFGSNGSGACIQDGNAADGVGRFPSLHGTGADGPNRRSPFQGFLWDAYRGPACYDGTCDSGEDASSCPYDCGD